MTQSSAKFPLRPRELLEACEKGIDESEPVDHLVCALFTVVGWSCAYILPIICSIGLLGTTMIIIIIVSNLRSLTRQLIYLLCMLSAGWFTNVLIAWLRLFPSRGLPYATNGTVYLEPRYLSPSACTFFSASSDLSFASYSNFLIVASLDRFIAIFFPIKMMRMQNHHAWMAMGAAMIFTLVTIVPTSVDITWISLGVKKICWFRRDRVLSLIMNQLFTFILPPFAVIILNVLFYSRIRLVCSRQGKIGKESIESQQLRASLTLFLLSIFYVVFTMPVSIFIFNALVNMGKHSKLNRVVQTSRATVYILWEVFFLRELANISIIVMKVPVVRSAIRTRIGAVRQYCTRTCPKSGGTSTNTINTSKDEPLQEKPKE